MELRFVKGEKKKKGWEGNEREREGGVKEGRRRREKET